MEHATEWVEEIASWSKLAFEFASISAVVIGGMVAPWQSARSGSFSRTLELTRRNFSRYLLTALELQLAADVIGTAIVFDWDRSWEQIVQLAAIALIRIFLGYFMTKETRDFDADRAAAVPREATS